MAMSVIDNGDASIAHGLLRKSRRQPQTAQRPSLYILIPHTRIPRSCHCSTPSVTARLPASCSTHIVPPLFLPPPPRFPYLGLVCRMLTSFSLSLTHVRLVVA